MGGLWEQYDVTEVASPQAWETNQELVLKFYKERRKQLLESEPNKGHIGLVELEHFFNVEIDTLFVTAVLTILSFSVHDTVVVYDRIRESIRTHPKVKFEDLVNKAVVETLTRSVNNSMTIIFMILCFYLLGGQTIKWFTFALLIGTISGTYSSTFTAAPLLILWEEIKKK